MGADARQLLFELARRLDDRRRRVVCRVVGGASGLLEEHEKEATGRIVLAKVRTYDDRDRVHPVVDAYAEVPRFDARARLDRLKQGGPQVEAQLGACELEK